MWSVSCKHLLKFACNIFVTYLRPQRRQSDLKSGWSWTRVKKFRFSRNISKKFGFFQAISQKIDFLGQFPQNFEFVSGNLTINRFLRTHFWKISIFSGNFIQNSDFSCQISENIDFPGKNWLFTAISGQIIFKGHHFRTYLMYMKVAVLEFCVWGLTSRYFCFGGLKWD